MRTCYGCLSQNCSVPTAAQRPWQRPPAAAQRPRQRPATSAASSAAACPGGVLLRPERADLPGGIPVLLLRAHHCVLPAGDCIWRPDP